jgi:NADPH:quinone reductase-like Zn-dependent oxidoreductase
MERDHYPITTPKTPTASAWWALMEDTPYDEEGSDVHEQNTETIPGSKWASSLWNMIVPEKPTSDLVSCFENLPISAVNDEKNNTNQNPDKRARSTPKVDTSQNQCENESFLQLFQNYCGNIQTTTFSKMELIQEGFIKRIEKSESPCKLLRKPNKPVLDEYEDACLESPSGGNFDSGIIPLTRVESPDIIHELKEDVASLRSTPISSKYKEILGSRNFTTDLSTHKTKKPIENPIRPHTERKFPVESSIDQLDANISPTKDNSSLKKSPKMFSGSPTRTMRTARTEGTTKISETPLPDTIVIDQSTDLPLLPLATVDTFYSGEIVKKISSITTQGEYFLPESQIDDLHSNHSKICVPPMLLKQFTSLKNISLSRSMSSAHSIRPFAVHALNKEFHSEPKQSRDIDELFTENGSKNHAYVAFFRRGMKASQSIRLYQHPIPAVFPILETEVVVHVEASTISQTDLMIRKGLIWGEDSVRELNLPIVPGVSFAGIVYQTSQTGHKSGLNVGDRVISLVQVGANSRHLCISSDHLVKVPDELNDPCSAACIPEVYLSAFQALHMGQKNGGRYKKTSLAGKRILILDGTNVFGRAFLEIALAAGCSTVYATSKEKHFQTISDAGGAPLGRDPRLWKSILAEKVDIIVGIDDTLGNSEITDDHFGLLSRNGRMVLLCSPERDESTSRLQNELVEEFKSNGKKLTFYSVFDSWEQELKQCKRDLTHLLKLLSEGCIRPFILESITLNKVARAQDLTDGKRLNGFIICEPWIKGKRKQEVLSNEVYAESASKSSQELSTVCSKNCAHCENVTERLGDGYVPIHPEESQSINVGIKHN